MAQDLSKVAKLYSDNIKEHGIDSKSVGWPDEKAQILRFEKLLDVIDKANDKAISVNDLGCGYGEMLNYMEKEGFDVAKFYGYDISEEMLEKAKEHIISDKAEFYKKERLDTKADYSITSGIFNVRFDEKEEQWIEYVKEVLNNMNDFSTKGFSFNLLSTYVDYKEDHLYYADPLFYFDYCKKNFSRFVTLQHDYPLYEWTIFVKKEA